MLPEVINCHNRLAPTCSGSRWNCFCFQLFRLLLSFCLDYQQSLALSQTASQSINWPENTLTILFIDLAHCPGGVLARANRNYGVLLSRLAGIYHCAPPLFRVSWSLVLQPPARDQMSGPVITHMTPGVSDDCAVHGCSE